MSWARYVSFHFSFLLLLVLFCFFPPCSNFLLLKLNENLVLHEQTLQSNDFFPGFPFNKMRKIKSILAALEKNMNPKAAGFCP